MKKTMLLLFLAWSILLLLNGCAVTGKPGKTSGTEANTGESGRTGEGDIMGEKDPRNQEKPVTGLRFIYDRFSGNQLYLNVFVENMSENGADCTIEKRVGPMNYTGFKKEGSLSLDGKQASELEKILGRYDLEAWSHLPSKSSGASPSRSVIVFSGDDVLYDVMWNAKFPETLPPQEDIFYAELFNFFNDLISGEPEWAEVKSDNLEDPRDNPAYYERRVPWFGHQVRLVPGTGTWYESGAYADIDYEGKDWWTEEGFTGTWTLDPEKSADSFQAPESAALRVREDGTIIFLLDGEEWTGAPSPVRRYKDSAMIHLEREGEQRACSVDLMEEESYERIHLTCYPGPVPEPQFVPIDVYLVKEE